MIQINRTRLIQWLETLKSNDKNLVWGGYGDWKWGVFKDSDASPNHRLYFTNVKTDDHYELRLSKGEYGNELPHISILKTQIKYTIYKFLSR